MKAIAASAGAFLLLASWAHGQSPQPGEGSQTQVAPWGSEVAPILARSAGVAEVDGQIVAGGWRYRAFFRDGAVEYHPALGERAATLQSVGLSLDSVQLGEELVHQSAGAVPQIRGENVSYAHDPGLVESYRVTPEGLELSFEFESLPRTGGDLVVRMDLTSTLPLDGPSFSEEGLRFETDELGGVHFGAVTGIDADGATVRGWLNLRGSTLELGLPGSFVAAAAFPLVLDPLISTSIEVAGSSDNHDPDVAYDATNDVYLVVWEAQFALTDFDVQAQRVDTSGNLVGSRIFVRTTVGGSSFDPVVANVNLSDRFAVIWMEGPAFGPYDLLAKSVDADTGALSTMSTLVTSAQEPAAASERTSDDEAMLVWRDVAAGGIKFGQVNVAGTSPSIFSIVSLSTSTSDFRPSISRSGGDVGQYLVAWQRFFSGSPGDHDVRLALVSRQSSILVPEFSWGSTFGPNEEDFACDGDGTNFIVVYGREASAGNGDGDIYARPVTYTGSALFAPVAGEVILASDIADDERDPAIAYNGETYTVLWSDEAGVAQEDIYGVVIHPFNCASCESQFNVAIGALDQKLPAIASQYNGGGSGDQSLIVYEEYDATATDGDILGRLNTSWGAYQDLGGGCGLAGTAQAGCARQGNSNFRHTLTGARATEVVYLVVGFEEIGFSCGSCTLVPDPWSGFLLTTGTDSLGNAAISTPLPNSPGLIGLSFIDQWIDSSGLSCTTLSGDLSNAIRVTIEG